MNTANITISKLKHFAPMSHETYCFTCDVLVDGKKVYTAENGGHGGSTNIHYAKPTTIRNQDELRGIEERVDELVHEAVMAKQKEKDAKSVARKLSKGIFFRIKGQKDGAYYSIKTDTPNDALFRDRVLSKHDVEVIINDLPLSEAIKYFYVY